MLQDLPQDTIDSSQDTIDSSQDTIDSRESSFDYEDLDKQLRSIYVEPCISYREKG